MAVIHMNSGLIAQLSFINTEDLKPGYYSFPDFMIIGPPRTGTTWLYRNLRFHPQIYMSTPKELIFFDRLDKPNDPHFQSDRLEWYCRFFSQGISQPFDKAQLVKETLNTLRNLRPSRRVRKGEATASYAIMEEAKIREIAILNPRIRIITAVRNPIHRAWSSLKRHLMTEKEAKSHFASRQLTDIAFEEFVDFYQSDYIARCGQFVKNINRWKHVIGSNKVLVYVFESIQEKPKELLKNIYEFLGVSSHESVFDKELYKKVIHQVASMEIPMEHREFLSDLYANEISALNEAFGLHYS